DNQMPAGQFIAAFAWVRWLAGKTVKSRVKECQNSEFRPFGGRQMARIGFPIAGLRIVEKTLTQWLRTLRLIPHDHFVSTSSSFDLCWSCE
ncbi:MAG TPA: hypothetical protein PKY22_08930, partial [Accumulibacter sp.]|nr:hypothetical protein [Accumulibacter sp.]